MKIKFISECNVSSLKSSNLNNIGFSFVGTYVSHNLTSYSVKLPYIYSVKCLYVAIFLRLLIKKIHIFENILHEIHNNQLNKKNINLY